MKCESFAKETSFGLRDKIGVKMECGKGKGKARPRSDHEAPDEELRYNLPFL
jgi:hypothetical protein